MKKILSILILAMIFTFLAMGLHASTDKTTHGYCGDFEFTIPEVPEDYEIKCDPIKQTLKVVRIKGYWGACAIQNHEFTGLCDFREGDKKVFNSSCEVTATAGDNCSVIFCRPETDDDDVEGYFLWDVNNKTGEVRSPDC